jgi:hypothetical protein
MMVATQANAARQFVSLSRLAGRLGVTPRKVMKLAEDAGVQPALFLDEAFYYDEAGADRIGEELKTQREARPA